MERLAEAIKLAAKLREESYDQKASDKAEKEERYCDYHQFYKLPLMEAANKAAEQVGFDTRGTLPTYLLLRYCWNDILDWAKQF